ncbi:hypothetical protein ALI144C_24865 [Actinosynnema sp. ALI-1.44]|nr:hypothetical protein ALI144C_24865 [Actinosynnema sp. ALI-1.44]
MAVVLALTAGCSTTEGTPVGSNKAELSKPVEVRLVVETTPPDIKLRDNAGEEYALGPVELRLERFKRAYIEYDKQGASGWLVHLELPDDLTGKLSELTQANVAKRMALIVDNLVVFAAQINGPIPGGKIQIQHRFTQQQAKDLLDSIGGER